MPAHLSARPCASLQIYGDRNSFLLDIPAGHLRGKQGIVVLQEMARLYRQRNRPTCPRLRAPSVMSRGLIPGTGPAQTGMRPEFAHAQACASLVRTSRPVTAWLPFRGAGFSERRPAQVLLRVKPSRRDGWCKPTAPLNSGVSRQNRKSKASGSSGKAAVRH